MTDSETTCCIENRNEIAIAALCFILIVACVGFVLLLYRRCSQRGPILPS